MAIYGVIVAIILQTKIESVNQLSNGLWPTTAYTAGYAILGSGLTTGWANLACGYVVCMRPSPVVLNVVSLDVDKCFDCSISVGVVGSSAALSDAQNSTLFVKILVVEIFGSALGLFGVIIGIIIAGQANFT